MMDRSADFASDRQRPAPAIRLGWGLLALAVALAAVLAVYSPALSNGFVWDDRANLLESPAYRGFGLAQIRWAFSTFRLGHYQPLTWLSFGLDYLMWGERPAGFHLTSILLHGLNAFLFGWLSLQLVRRAQPAVDGRARHAHFVAAVVAAAVFALHPLRVESVAWVTERRDVLSGLFFLSSILMYLRAYANRSRHAARTTWYCLSLVAFELSLLSKSLGLALPLVLLVLDVYPLGRIPRSPRRWTNLAARRVYLEKAPFFALAVVCGLIAIAAQARSGALFSVQTHGLSARLAQAVYGLIFYLRATVATTSWYPLYEWPFNLNPFEWRYVLSGIAVVVLTAFFMALRHRFPAGLAAWLCYVGLLLPVLGLAQSGVQFVADRYSYLACLGWAVLAGTGVARCWHATSSPTGRALCAGAAALVLSLWTGLTWRQIPVWRDEERLWRHVLTRGPSAMAYNNLGALALLANDRPAAATDFSRALTVMPTYARARRNLLETLGASVSSFDAETRQLAAGALERSLQFDPVDGAAWLELGILQASRERFAQAKAAFQRATRLAPDESFAWLGLGICLYKTGDSRGAIVALEHALRIDPSNAQAGALLSAIRGGPGPDVGAPLSQPVGP
ncbi:MAG TPA: tetratricopeptide repeat protein [Phycisphaerae bacterium]